MFYQTKRTAAKAIARSKLISVLSSEVLLSDLKRKDNIQAIQLNLGFSPHQFQQLVQPVIDEVAVGCQLLPSTEHRFYGLPGGLLDFSIYRAQAAMLIFRQSILPPDTQELSDEQALWAYVLLTAGLLRGLGIICTDYRIECYTEHGYSMGVWQPLWERFLDRTPFYTMEFNEEIVEDLSSYLTPFIARLWMPMGGFSWIASHPDMFLVWLQLLQEEKEGMHVLQAILERSEAIAWQRLAKDAFAGLSIGFPAEQARLSTFSQPLENQMSLEMIGVQFLLWLKENLARGQMVLNQNTLKLTENGLIIDQELFKLFIQQNNQFKNWRLIQQAVMSLNLHDKDFQNKDVLLLTKAGLFLPKEVIIRQANQMHHAKIQSMALNFSNNWKQAALGKTMDLDILNKRLNAQGKFEQFNETLKRGFKHD